MPDLLHSFIKLYISKASLSTAAVLCSFPVGTLPNVIPGTIEEGGITRECWHFVRESPQAKNQLPLRSPFELFRTQVHQKFILNTYMKLFGGGTWNSSDRNMRGLLNESRTRQVLYVFYHFLYLGPVREKKNGETHKILCMPGRKEAIFDWLSFGNNILFGQNYNKIMILNDKIPTAQHRVNISPPYLDDNVGPLLENDTKIKKALPVWAFTINSTATTYRVHTG